MWVGCRLGEAPHSALLVLQRKFRHHIPPHFGPFWAYSRTLPQGVELLV